MRRISAIALFLIGLFLCAQSPLPGFPPGVFTNRAALDPASSPSYSGPGDASGVSWLAWSSCARAYTAAYAASQGALCDIVDTATGLAACTIHAGTNGFANMSAVACPTGAPTVSVTTFCTITHAGGCSVAKAYDQTVSDLCSTSCDFVQATLANMPTLNLSALNSLPCMSFLNTSSQVLTATEIASQAQPFTMSSVSKRVGNTGSYNGIIATGNYGQGYPSTSGQMVMFAGSVATFSATEAVFHALQGVFNGASSTYYLDGSGPTTVDPGTGTGAGGPLSLGIINGAFLDGLICEAGYYQGSLSSAAQAAVNSNQHGSNGYNF
jgi:hypothetical protein